MFLSKKQTIVMILIFYIWNSWLLLCILLWLMNFKLHGWLKVFHQSLSGAGDRNDSISHQGRVCSMELFNYTWVSCGICSAFNQLCSRSWYQRWYRDGRNWILKKKKGIFSGDCTRVWLCLLCCRAKKSPEPRCRIPTSQYEADRRGEGCTVNVCLHH